MPPGTYRRNVASLRSAPAERCASRKEKTTCHPVAVRFGRRRTQQPVLRRRRSSSRLRLGRRSCARSAFVACDARAFFLLVFFCRGAATWVLQRVCACVRFVVRYRDRRLPASRKNTSRGRLHPLVALLAASAKAQPLRNIRHPHCQPASLLLRPLICHVRGVELGASWLPTRRHSRTARVFVTWFGQGPVSCSDPVSCATASACEWRRGAWRVDAPASPPGLPNLGRAWHVKTKAPAPVAPFGNGFLSSEAKCVNFAC